MLFKTNSSTPIFTKWIGSKNSGILYRTDSWTYTADFNCFCGTSLNGILMYELIESKYFLTTDDIALALYMLHDLMLVAALGEKYFMLYHFSFFSNVVAFSQKGPQKKACFPKMFPRVILWGRHCLNRTFNSVISSQHFSSTCLIDLRGYYF